MKFVLATMTLALTVATPLSVKASSILEEQQCQLAMPTIDMVARAFVGGVPVNEVRGIMADPGNGAWSAAEMQWKQRMITFIYKANPSRLDPALVVKVQKAVCLRLGYDDYIAFAKLEADVRQQPTQTPPATHRRPSNTTCYTNSDGAGGGYTNCTTY
jgi:hypothetical protein